MPSVSEVYLIPQAAEQLDIPRTTLAAAIARGDIPTHLTGCGRQTVLLADCEQFLATSPGRGFCDPETRKKAQATLAKRKREKT